MFIKEGELKATGVVDEDGRVFWIVFFVVLGLVWWEVFRYMFKISYVRDSNSVF